MAYNLRPRTVKGIQDVYSRKSDRVREYLRVEGIVTDGISRHRRSSGISRSLLLGIIDELMNSKEFRKSVAISVIVEMNLDKEQEARIIEKILG